MALWKKSKAVKKKTSRKLAALVKKIKKVQKSIKKVGKSKPKKVQVSRKKVVKKKVTQKRAPLKMVKAKTKKKVTIKKAGRPMPLFPEPQVDIPSPPSIELKEGEAAPPFRLQDDQGQVVSLSDLLGKKVVLYFYPKDDTPGCTKEACSFRDGIAQIQAKGASVYGVSADSVGSHQAFKQKYNLNFPLLSDESKDVAQRYGVWKQKSMYGRTYMGIERTTFLIDEAGKIAQIFPKVDVEAHYQEVLNAL